MTEVFQGLGTALATVFGVACAYLLINMVAKCPQKKKIERRH